MGVRIADLTGEAVGVRRARLPDTAPVHAGVPGAELLGAPRIDGGLVVHDAVAVVVLAVADLLGRRALADFGWQSGERPTGPSGQTGPGVSTAV
jgi:hypothetical protein